MNILHRAYRLLKDHRGQSLLIIALLTPVFFALLATVVDVGLLLGERTAAQKTVDAAALAGAQELAKDLSAPPGGAQDTQWATNAESRALEWVKDNSVTPNAEYTKCPVATGLGGSATQDNACADTACFADNPSPSDLGLNDTVTVDLEGPSQTFFGRIFGTKLLGVGAHARACVGSLTGTTGLRPWVISIQTSACFQTVNGVVMFQFGQDCALRTDNSDQTGSIRLNTGSGACGGGNGAKDYYTNIVDGSKGWCSIGDMVNTEPGMDTNKTETGVHDLVATEGKKGGCDDKFCTQYGKCNGIDDFGEAFSPADATPSPDVVYTARDCTTPRVVNVVIVDGFDKNGMDTVPIRGFASFFIFGCAPVDNKTGQLGTMDPKCNVSTPKFAIIGRFMNVLNLSGTGGPLNPFGTRIIYLDQ